MKPKVTETYVRQGVYATIKGVTQFEVRPDEDERYALLGPNHKSIHRGYYEAVKEGIALASQPREADKKVSSQTATQAQESRV